MPGPDTVPRRGARAFLGKPKPGFSVQKTRPNKKLEHFQPDKKRSGFSSTAFPGAFTVSSDSVKAENALGEESLNLSPGGTQSAEEIAMLEQETGTAFPEKDKSEISTADTRLATFKFLLTSLVGLRAARGQIIH